MTKTPARGSVLAVKINGNYVNIPGIQGLPRMGRGAKAEYENTGIDELSRTFGTDLSTPPTLEVTGSWDSKDAAHAYLLASANNVAATEDFQATYKSGAKFQCLGKVLSFDIEASQGKDESFYMGIKWTGTVNITAAT